MKTELSQRKKKILKAVVDEYISSASPVSSGGIKQKYFDDVSSATIRAELSTLEDMGYLIQPHTSAGRVPSKEAYLMYVSEFLEEHPLSREEISLIDNSFREKFTEVEDIIKRTAKVISDVTNYTSVIVLKNINKVTIKNIKLVGLDEKTALVIIITDSGIIRDKVIEISGYAKESDLADAAAVLNKAFAGKTVAEVRNPDEALSKELGNVKILYNSVLKILESYAEKADEDFVVEGASKMLSHPDTDISSARNFLSLVESRRGITSVIDRDEDIEFSVKIGKDDTGGLDGCAIVTAKYSIGGHEVGHAGVIGPERMDYGKVMSVLHYIAGGLDRMIGQGKGVDDDED